ncbi:GGDEF domain-containing protein [Shewanella woodyi]|uniref:GGDEF domain-containing protein n=1 Tax=Shewanella woodyi TaxID=60961 RepID=UPI0009EF4B44|nr:GGDEF domain-containing protein [Shewanella woodyi]
MLEFSATSFKVISIGINANLPSFERQLKTETHLYLIKGAMWATVISLFMLLAILFNIYLQNSDISVFYEAIKMVSPLVIITFSGALAAYFVKRENIATWGLYSYLFLLEIVWVYLVWRLFHFSNDRLPSYGALAGVESIIDILVLTIAIAVFPNRNLMLMGVLPLMVFSCSERVLVVPDQYLFPLTKFFCFLAIIVSGQKVLSSWFNKAILRNVEKQYLLAQFRRLALVDSLTDISNRRHFDEILLQEIRASERTGHPLGLVLIDVDYFKRLNDSAGHQSGDECLVEIAKILTVTANRPRDLAARYGGEEFVLLLPETDIAGCTEIAEALKRKLAAAKLPHPDSDIGSLVTISQGVTLWKEGMGAQELLECADSLLYQAKSSGRDRFIAA